MEALRALAFQDKLTVEEIVRESGLECVVSAMASHADSQSVSGAAVKLLWNIVVAVPESSVQLHGQSRELLEAARERFPHSEEGELAGHLLHSMESHCSGDIPTEELEDISVREHSYSDTAEVSEVSQETDDKIGQERVFAWGVQSEDPPNDAVSAEPPFSWGVPN